MYLPEPLTPARSWKRTTIQSPEERWDLLLPQVKTGLRCLNSMTSAMSKTTRKTLSTRMRCLIQSVPAPRRATKNVVKRGWPTMTILGWETPPRYNEITHNLEWAIRAQSEGAPVVNHNTRLLGRGGVMEVTLVTDPATLAETLPKFKTMLAGFEFKQGHRYAEFRAGDRTAAYGLTGLIVGGGTAALVKTGALSGFGKYSWLLVLALWLCLRRSSHAIRPRERSRSYWRRRKHYCSS